MRTKVGRWESSPGANIKLRVHVRAELEPSGPTQRACPSQSKPVTLPVLKVTLMLTRGGAWQANRKEGCPG